LKNIQQTQKPAQTAELLFLCSGLFKLCFHCIFQPVASNNLIY